MKPRIPITDPSFRYVCAAKTDVRKTWAKARARMAEEAAAKVQPIKRTA